MTAHQLARKLMDGPDLPVCTMDSYGDHELLQGIEEMEEGYFDEECEVHHGPHILLS